MKKGKGDLDGMSGRFFYFMYSPYIFTNFLTTNFSQHSVGENKYRNLNRQIMFLQLITQIKTCN